MNQTELEKCRNDVVYFVEKYLGLELLQWQKDILNHYNNGQIIFTGGHRYGKNMIIDSIKKHREMFQ